MDYKLKDNKLLIKIKVIPGAGKNAIDRVMNNELVIKIKAAPEKGKANKELIRYLSKELRIAKSEIVIISGTVSRHKYLSLPESSLIYFKKYLTRD